MKSMRPSTLESLGLGDVLEIVTKGCLPVSTSDMVDRVFGKEENRGALVISGAGGIVGAGKTMQLASRLVDYQIPIIALDLAGAPDCTASQFKGLQESFGTERAHTIMNSIIRLSYDGTMLPPVLKQWNPRLLIEAIPEKLELKRAHYKLFKEEFPDVHIVSVTSGFPSKELGVDIAHPSFPHHINKVFEMVEEKPSDFTKLLWSLGLIPMQVSDHWSFVLDVFFCGLLQSSIQFCNLTNTPYWKADKYIRHILGPNPFRAHDAIGAKGANFLTWSCLHHLGQVYGELFTPSNELTEHKDSGQNWYPLSHFRPVVNWKLDSQQLEDLKAIVYGSLIQMTTIMINEKRTDLSTMTAIGEVCAQFTNGIPALIRRLGTKQACQLVERYHQLVPPASRTPWYPDTLEDLSTPEWMQLYVNAEHDGKVGVITISRESYNYDVDSELNRAIDWLHTEGIQNVVLTSDFHFSTQMVGADTTEFFPAVTDSSIGERISEEWSRTARRLYTEFEISIGFIHGKRCMGGMLELMMHCHYLIAPEYVRVGMPEVTLPVIPGMEGCHWILRKSSAENTNAMLEMLLNGRQISAKQAVGYLVDYSGTFTECLSVIGDILRNDAKALPKRKIIEEALTHIEAAVRQVPLSDNQQIREAQTEIADCVIASCSATADEALLLQSKASARFIAGKLFRKGKIGIEYDKTYQN